MELETINKLYLELSQVATATTAREQKLHEGIGEIRQLASDVLFELNNKRFVNVGILAEKIETLANELLP